MLAELNVDTSAGGAIRVEMLYDQGQEIPELSGDNAHWLVCNSVCMPPTWEGSPDLSRWQGQAIRLRFTLCDCKLYAF